MMKKIMIVWMLTVIGLMGVSNIAKADNKEILGGIIVGVVLDKVINGNNSGNRPVDVTPTRNGTIVVTPNNDRVYGGVTYDPRNKSYDPKCREKVIYNSTGKPSMVLVCG